MSAGENQAGIFFLKGRKKMKKRILATILCICVVTGAVGVPIAQAGWADADTAAPPSRWTNTSLITLNMSLNNGTITSSGQVVGKTGTTRISVIFTLEKLVGGRYVYVDSWSASSSSMICSSTRDTKNCTSGTYKLTVAGTVTKDNYAEPIEDWLVKNL